jgi:hypothetical protein
MGRPVHVNLPHSLGKDEARKRIDEGFGRMRQQMTSGLAGMLAFQESWEGDRLNFEATSLGQKLTGRLDVRADAVDIEVDLPDFLAALAERIQGSLKKEGQKLLERK